MDKKIQLIDLVRSFSILSVLAFHLGFYAKAPQNIWLMNLWVAFGTKGLYGVYFFFLVSGFLITRLIDTNLGGLLQPNLRNFYIRRVARIGPLLVLHVLIGVILLMEVQNPGERFQRFFKNSTASFDWVFWLSLPTFSLNWLLCFMKSKDHLFGIHWDLLWSLSIEEQFYFLYPFLLKCLRPRQFLWVLLFILPPLGLLSRWLAYRWDPSNHNLIYVNSFSGFEEISLGIILYLTYKKYGPFFSRKPILCLAVCGIGLFILVETFRYHFHMEDLIWIPSAFGVGLFIFLLGGLHLNFFNSALFRPFSLPGKVSYGMYLWHACVLFVLWPLFGSYNAWASFGIATSVTFVLAVVSYYFYEMPMNREIRDKLELRH